MKYRIAQLADIPGFVAIEKSQPRCAQWTAQDWQTELADASAYVLCACEQDQVIGFVSLRLAGGVGEILNVGVLPEVTRQGVGFMLLDAVLEQARQRGGESLTLEVGKNNAPAVKLYQKAGFKQVGVRKNFYPNNEDALIMGRTL